MDRLAQKLDILLRAHFAVIGCADCYDTYIGPVFQTRLFRLVLISLVSGFAVQHWMVPFLSRWQVRLTIRKKIDAERARRRTNHETFTRIVDDFMQSDTINTVAFKRALEAVEESPMKVMSLLEDGTLDPISVLRVYQRNCLRAQDYGNPCTEFLLDAENEIRNLEIADRGVRPLWGLIISAKEHFSIQGTEATAGLGRYLGVFNNVPNDSTIVRAFRRLGGVVITKTNVPQTMWSYSCSNPIYDYTAHPFNQARCPGGSSGGEGCLLALNGTALGIGSDGGGSVRIPAHFCGVAALKPTAARLGTSELLRFFERSPVTNIAIGFMCRDVELLVYAFKSIVEDGFIYQVDPFAVNIPWREHLYRGDQPHSESRNAAPPPHGGTGFRAAPSTQPFTFHDSSNTGVHNGAEADVQNSAGDRTTSVAGTTSALSSFARPLGSRLRIGWYDTDDYFPPTPACRRAVHEAKEMLLTRGHELITFQPPNVAEAFDIFMGGMKPVVVELLDDVVSQEPSDVAVRYVPRVWRYLLAGPLNPIVRLVSERAASYLSLYKRIRTAEDMGKLLSRKGEYCKLFIQAWKEKELDVLICPAFGVTATPHDVPRDLISAVSYTCLFNLLDFPAGVVPITHVTERDESLLDSYPTDDFLLSLAQKSSRGSVGLPVGVQVVSKPYNEELVLRVMRELQQIRKEHFGEQRRGKSRSGN